jgi:serine/threonine protein kinase
MTPTSIGPYRIVRQLGEGGMGVVYEARQESLDRRVALKTLHPEYARNQETVTRFFNEAKVLSRLEHPSIVQVSDFGTTSDGTAYLVMEYLRGESLGHRLGALADRGERLPVVTTLQIAWQVADVLAVGPCDGRGPPGPQARQT